jgi:hypothetical protein
MIKIGKKPRQLADRSDAIDIGLRPSRTEGRGETTGRPVRFRVRPSSSLPAPLRSGTGFVPSPEPSLRGAVRSSPPAPLVPRAAPPWLGEKAVAASRLFGIDRSLRRFGTARAPAPSPLRPRSVSAPLRSGPVSASSAGALTARSLHCAEPLLRRSLCAAGLRTSARSESQPSLFPASRIITLPYSWLPSLRGAGTAVPEGRGAGGAPGAVSMKQSPV